MSVKGLHSPQQLPVVSAVYQHLQQQQQNQIYSDTHTRLSHLCVVFHCLCEDRERTCLKLLILLLLHLLLCQITLGLVPAPEREQTPPVFQIMPTTQHHIERLTETTWLVSWDQEYAEITCNCNTTSPLNLSDSFLIILSGAFPNVAVTSFWRMRKSITNWR